MAALGARLHAFRFNVASAASALVGPAWVLDCDFAKTQSVVCTSRGFGLYLVVKGVQAGHTLKLMGVGEKSAYLMLSESPVVSNSNVLEELGALLRSVLLKMEIEAGVVNVDNASQHIRILCDGRVLIALERMEMLTLDAAAECDPIVHAAHFFRSMQIQNICVSSCAETCMFFAGMHWKSLEESEKGFAKPMIEVTELDDKDFEVTSFYRSRSPRAGKLVHLIAKTWQIGLQAWEEGKARQSFYNSRGGRPAAPFNRDDFATMFEHDEWPCNLRDKRAILRAIHKALPDEDSLKNELKQCVDDKVIDDTMTMLLCRRASQDGAVELGIP